MERQWSAVGSAAGTACDNMLPWLEREGCGVKRRRFPRAARYMLIRSCFVLLTRRGLHSHARPASAQLHARLERRHGGAWRPNWIAGPAPYLSDHIRCLIPHNRLALRTCVDTQASAMAHPTPTPRSASPMTRCNGWVTGLEVKLAHIIGLALSHRLAPQPRELKSSTSSFAVLCRSEAIKRWVGPDTIGVDCRRSPGVVRWRGLR